MQQYSNSQVNELLGRAIQDSRIEDVSFALSAPGFAPTAGHMRAAVEIATAAEATRLPAALAVLESVVRRHAEAGHGQRQPIDIFTEARNVAGRLPASSELFQNIDAVFVRYKGEMLRSGPAVTIADVPQGTGPNWPSSRVRFFHSPSAHHSPR